MPVEQEQSVLAITRRAIKCDDDAQYQMCLTLVELARKGAEPIAFVYRTPAGQIEVQARGEMIGTVTEGIAIMREATERLAACLLERGN